MAHPLEHPGHDDRALEHVALVHQVGEAMGVLLGTELAPGALPFLVVQRKNPAAQFLEQARAHRVLEHNITVVIELTALSVGQAHR
jgi:hypothetical protein